MSLSERECPECGGKMVPARGPRDQMCEPCRQESEWLAATGERKSWQQIQGLIREHGIKTTHVYPPIPIRSMDWQAVRDNDEPNDDGHMLVGHGPTEMAAVADLVDTLESLKA